MDYDVTWLTVATDDGRPGTLAGMVQSMSSTPQPRFLSSWLSGFGSFAAGHGLAVNLVVVIALAFFLRAKVTSSGVPTGVQLFWEAITIFLRDQIETTIGMRIGSFVLPLAVTLFAFILIANWLSVVPLQYRDSTGTHELLQAPASDINFTLALAAFVFLFYHGAGIWRRGLFGYLRKLVKGHIALLAPINLIEELSKPISLSLRLFGNMFAGGILVALIGLFPWYILWLPNAIWKSFDLFVGAIQAFIFALLTILYFSQSMELDEESH